MLTQYIKTPTIEKLHKHGVHFVLCRSKDEGNTRKAKRQRGSCSIMSYL